MSDALQKCRDQARALGLACLELEPGPGLLIFPAGVGIDTLRQAMAGLQDPGTEHRHTAADCQVSVAEREELFALFRSL